MGSNVANIAVETIEHFDELRWLILDRFRKTTFAKPVQSDIVRYRKHHSWTMGPSASPFR